MQHECTAIGINDNQAESEITTLLLLNELQ